MYPFRGAAVKGGDGSGDKQDSCPTWMTSRCLVAFPYQFVLYDFKASVELGDVGSETDDTRNVFHGSGDKQDSCPTWMTSQCLVAFPYHFVLYDFRASVELGDVGSETDDTRNVFPEHRFACPLHSMPLSRRPPTPTTGGGSGPNKTGPDNRSRSGTAVFLVRKMCWWSLPR